MGNKCLPFSSKSWSSRLL